MGKSFLVLLMLIITLVATPFFGSFGEAIDKPVVFAASTLSEYTINQVSNSQYQLELSFAVPQKTAVMNGTLMFTYESDINIIINDGPREFVWGPELIIESDRDVHTFNPGHIKIVTPLDPLQVGPAILVEPFAYV